MSWARLDDGMPENEKIADLSDAAFRGQVTAICYAARNLTDGYLPARFAKQYVRTNKVLKELVPALWHLPRGLCEQCRSWPEAMSAVEGKTDGYYIHDYLDYNPTRAQVLEERAKRQTSKVKGGQARAAAAPRGAGGKFTSTQPALSPANHPAAHQQTSSPDPDPVPDPRSSSPATATGASAREPIDRLVSDFARFGTVNELTVSYIEDAVDVYGLDRVHEAVKTAAKGQASGDKPPWGYVESILKNPLPKEHRNGRPETSQRTATGRSRSAVAAGPDIEGWKRYKAGEG